VLPEQNQQLIFKANLGVMLFLVPNVSRATASRFDALTLNAA
jgi:hypothetical protein